MATRYHLPVRQATRTMACVMVLVLAVGCSQEDRQQLMEQAGDTVDQIAEKSSEVTESISEKSGSMQESITENTQSLQQSIQETISQGSTAAAEQLSLAGSVELDTSPPVKTNACYVKLIPPSTERPAFLQIRSYKSADAESFPSVFLQGPVEGTDLSSLQNKTIPMQMFVQFESLGMVAYAEMSAPVQVSIDSVEGRQVAASIAPGATLTPTDGSEPIVFSGKFAGVAE